MHSVSLPAILTPIIFYITLRTKCITGSSQMFQNFLMTVQKLDQERMKHINKHFLRTMMLDYFCPIVNSDLAFLEVYSV